MSNQDIRWIQRFSNFNKAYARFEEAVSLAKTRELSELEAQGLIKSFEYTHELAWLVMKDYFLYQGHTQIRGSKDAIREAFKNELIEDGEGWMETIVSRINTVHTYSEEIANEVTDKIINKYYKLFQSFRFKMEEIIAGK